jgi:hypothetical protein
LGTLDNLSSELRKTIAFLDGVNEKVWASRLVSYEQRLAKSDKSVLADLRREFGGMGTLNDLYLTRINGHSVPPDSEKRLNAELNQLRQSIYQALRDASFDE